MVKCIVVQRYFKTILIFPWTNSGFKPITMLFLNIMQIDDHTTDSIPSFY